MPFPKGYDQGFGFAATFKVSPDGKLLYVFDQDIVVFDLKDLREVDRIELSKPVHPGASPYRLSANDDPNDDPRFVTSVFTSVDPIVHKETLGCSKARSTDEESRLQTDWPGASDGWLCSFTGQKARLLNDDH